jgi:hypothetical protein
MEKGIDSGKTLSDQFAKELGLHEPRVDQAWCSELCKKKVSGAVLANYPCKQKFSRIDVTPLFACGAQRFYRVTLWVDDWSTVNPIKEIWKTFSVILEGIERKVVSIKESQKRKLPLTERGRKFMEELGVSGVDKE